MMNVYKNPPLVEALCEFQFNTDAHWDVTIFGDYYQCVRAEFSKKRELNDIEFSFKHNQGLISGDIQDRGIRMQFVKADKSAMVQISPYRLIVNKLTPYQSWVVFKSLIQNRLEDYHKVVKKQSCHKVSLRYINRFDFPSANFTVGKYFERTDIFPIRLYDIKAPFLMHLEIPEDIASQILVTIGIIEPKNNQQLSVLLDISCVINITDLDMTAILAQLDKAHNHIEILFESCLTDKLRQRFN